MQTSRLINNMNKRFIQELKEKLEQEKINIENNLKKFAKKDDKVKGDWDTTYPQFGSKIENQQLEAAADEVEEYANLLPVEHNLELQLQSVNRSLEKIKNGTYGKCKKCGKEINKERLKVFPAAETCSKCHKKK